MRVAILTAAGQPHVPPILSRLVVDCPGMVAGLIETRALLSGMGRWKGLGRCLAVAGPGYVLVQATKQWIVNARELLSSDHPSARRIAAAHDIPVLRTDTVLAPEVHDAIREWRPDLLLSLLLRERVPDALLRLAPEGGVNFHPSLLPEYRGVSPTFWALADGRAATGVSLHRMVHGFDEGDLIAQAEVAIPAGTSEHALFARCADTGTDLLVRALRDWPRALAGARPQPKVGGSYRSLPDRDAIRRFHARGGTWWRGRDLV